MVLNTAHLSRMERPASNKPHFCQKCCRPPSCGESAGKDSKSSIPFSNEESLDIIRSPLDDRAYKSLVLPNGVRVMLISTYDIDIEPEEQDATKPPCQVPEVAEFNKTYLGFDNPAARVKCACPCDERKPCCSRGQYNDEVSTKSRKSILKEYEAIRETCCSRKAKAPTEKKNVSFDAANIDEFKKHVSRNSVPGDLQEYQNVIFSELQKRAQAKTKFAACRPHGCCNAREGSTEKGQRLPSHMPKSNKHDDVIAGSIIRPITDSEIIRGNCTYRPDEKSQANISRSKSLIPVPSDEDFKQKPSDLHHYPYPPTYSHGLHSVHPCPIGTSRSRARSGRGPRFSTQFNSDFDGTAYLVIGSGYFDDPDDQPGLAHFCEHAVFLGSNKFPEPNQLFKLVLPYEGYVNAYTSGMMTTFTTSASFRLFPLAVEILADMVGFPLFPNALVAAELEALDSEYSLRQDDTPKYFQLIGSLAKKGHVIRKMDSGNINTLTVPNFYRKLVEWRRIYYSPSRMTLALEAPFPLDFMERLVMESFGRIPSAAPLPPIHRNQLLHSPFEMSRFHQIYHVPSVYHSEFLALHWALDAKGWKNLKTKPLEYLGAIISHKGEGGLFHYLTSHDLATNVEAGCWESDVTRNHFTSVFSISVDMTDKGFKRQDNILQAIFGYIQMLINLGPQKTFFQELQKQDLDAFHYKAAESSLSVADSISRWMQFIPPKWSLISPAITPDFDEKLIRKYTESLKIETANVIIFSKNYRGLENMSSMEEFYNTPYASYKFPEELEQKMHRTRGEYSTKFSIPPANELLLETACSRSRQKDLLQPGPLYKVKGKLTVGYISRNVRVARGLLPQARYSIWIGSPVFSYLGAPEGSSTKMILWSRLFNDIFETKFYHAANADIQLETEIAQGELHISIAGPHTMLPPLVERVISLFNNFENVVDQVSFEVSRSTFIESLDNTILDNRFLAWDLFYYLWTNNHDLIFDHKRNGERLTFANFIHFIKSFKSKMYIQAHLYGYVTKAQGQSVVNALSNLEYAPIELRQYMLFRCLRLPVGERIVKVSSQNPNIHTSVVINSYQFGMLSEEEEDAVSFFAKSMSDAAFYQLRTEQQLGYIIIIYAEITFGVSSIVIELVTQPKNFTTEYCDECIDTFLEEFFDSNLANYECFEEFSLGKPKLELPYQSMCDLYRAYLLRNPETFRKLSIQVVGSLQQDALSPVTKNAYKPDSPTQQQQQVVYTNSPRFPPDEIESPSPPAYRTPSVGAKTAIDNVRAAKRSMRLKGDSIAHVENGKKRSSSGSSIPSRVVQAQDIAKFKNSLVYYPIVG